MEYAQRLAEGNIPNTLVVDKHGRSTNVDSGVNTDIWDRANSTNDQDEWTAPTQARVHALVSASANDDKDAGTGARKVRVYGLQSWDTEETYEDIELEGLTPVNTVNSYVIIHRMEVKEWGASGPNVGLITATAATDSTVTAQINVGEGQTQMAIYGVPANKALYIHRMYANTIASGGGSEVVMKLKVNDYVDIQILGYKTKHTFSTRGSGSSNVQVDFKIPKKIQGPCIVKLQANGDSANMDVSAGFDALVR